MIKVSIIIPVCNVEIYLRECMESVINQTLQDIEIICVDDGSTDNCPTILEEYAKLDPRVIVIHQENAGYGRAMNVGIARATGEYIGIVESDDYVQLNMFEALYQQAKEYDLEVLKSYYYQLYTDEEGNNRLTLCGNRNQFEHVILNFKKDDIGQYHLPLAMIWSSVYKREFLQNAQIYFNESPGASYQDIAFRLATTYMCTRYMYIPEAYYCYRIDNPNSSVKSKEKLYCKFEEYEYLRTYLQQYPNLYKKYRRDIFHKSISDYFYNLPARIHPNLMLETCEYLRDYIVNHQEQGEFRKEYLHPGQEIIIELLLKSPHEASLYFQEQYNKRLDTIKHIGEIIKKETRIYIYGGGIVGQSVLNTFAQCKASHKITGFAITNLQGSKVLSGIPCYDIEDIEDKECMLILGVSKRKSMEFYNEMRANAVELGFRNIVDYDEL